MEVIKRRKSGIDLTKFVFALLVVAAHIHFFGNQTTENVYSYLNFGLQQYICRLTVPFFFVCNGYFLFRKIDFDRIDFGILKKSLLSILKLYIIWSIIYFPINLYKMLKSGKPLLPLFLNYAREFLFTGSYTHLWYLNGLLVAFLIITVLLKTRIKPYQIFFISLVLYIVGLLGDSYNGILYYHPNVVTSFYECYNKAFITTRNGAFFGLLFVSMGMMMSVKDNKLDKKRNVFLFFIAMACLLVEVFLLKYYDVPKDYNMYLFTIPAIYFLFYSVKEFSVCSDKAAGFLDNMSKLIYFGHLWINFLFSFFMRLLPESISATPFRCVSVTILTVIASMTVIKLSSLKAFSWLKDLY